MANEVAHPSSLYWMVQVQERARMLSLAKVRFQDGLIDLPDLKMIQKAHSYAVQQYTDPLGRKHGQAQRA